MSYLGFHLVFILPAIALLAAGSRRWRGRLGRRAPLFLPLMAGIALIYTTPWDNYLVWRGIWSYGTDRVLGTIGYVPVEEYLFFLLQPIMTGLWLYWILGGRAGTPPVPTRWRDAGGEAPRHLTRGLGALVYLALAVGGWLLLRQNWGTYLGLILVWAAPVLALQWAYAGGEIWRRRPAWLLGVAVPTLYLWIADAIAIRLGIWSIAEPTTTGLMLLGLPLEEAVFFLATNLLVVQGLLLFLFPPGARPEAPAPPRRPSLPMRVEIFAPRPSDQEI